MRIIQTHLGKVIAESTLMVLGAVIALMIFANFVSEMRDLGHGDYNLTEAFIYVLLTLPQQLYDLFPMAAMLGVVLGLGALSSNSELIVLRGSGLSIGQITTMVLKAVLVMIAIVGIVGVGITPQLTHYAEKRKLLATSSGQALTTGQGTWLKSGNNFLHIQSILPGGHFTGITWYSFDNTHHLLTARYAKSGEYKQDHLELKDITASEFTQNAVTTQQLSISTLKMTLNPMFMHAAETGPHELSLFKLYKFIHYQKSNGLHASEFVLAFWQRLFNPIAALVMIFLAIPCVFGPLRSSTMGLKIITGVVIGFSFYIVNEFFGPISIVYQFPPILGAVLPTLLFFLVGLVLIKRL